MGLRAHTAPCAGPQDPLPKGVYTVSCHQYQQQLGTAEGLRPCALFTCYSPPSKDLRTPNYFAPHGEERWSSHLCVVPGCAVPGGWHGEHLVSHLHTKNVCKIISSNKIYTYKRITLTWMCWKFKMDRKNGYHFQCKARNPVPSSADPRLNFCLFSSSWILVKAEKHKPAQRQHGAGGFTSARALTLGWGSRTSPVLLVL